jgi:hypothetical protein
VCPLLDRFNGEIDNYACGNGLLSCFLSKEGRHGVGREASSKRTRGQAKVLTGTSLFFNIHGLATTGESFDHPEGRCPPASEGNIFEGFEHGVIRYYRMK